MRSSDKVFPVDVVSTIGVDFKIKHAEIDGTRVQLQFWDTSGDGACGSWGCGHALTPAAARARTAAERMRPVTASVFPRAQAALVVFDVTDRRSFEDVEAWLGRVRASGAGDVQVVLVGNKCDIVERVGSGSWLCWGQGGGVGGWGGLRVGVRCRRR